VICGGAAERDRVVEEAGEHQRALQASELPRPPGAAAHFITSTAPVNVTNRARNVARRCWSAAAVPGRRALEPARTPHRRAWPSAVPTILSSADDEPRRQCAPGP
jgi:hypothetical protein